MIKNIAKVTVLIHTNDDGVRATAIVLRSNVASSEMTSEASLMNYIDRPSSGQLRACSDVLPDALSGEGHISHCNRAVFMFRWIRQSFIRKTRLGQFVYYLWKNLRVFVSHNSAGFHWTFHLHILYETLWAEVLD